MTSHRDVKLLVLFLLTINNIIPDIRNPEKSNNIASIKEAPLLGEYNWMASSNKEMINPAIGNSQ